MLQNAETLARRWRGGESVGAGRPGAGSLPALIDRLQQLGFTVPPLYGRRQDVAGGVPMRVPVSGLPGPDSGVEEEVLEVVGQGVPVTLSVTDLGGDDNAIRNLQRFCESLREKIVSGGHRGDLVGMCMYSHQVPLQAFQVISSAIPGGGPRYVLLDFLQMTEHGNRQVRSESRKVWAGLWRSRGGRAALAPVYGATVRTGCPLLSDEVASSVLPVSGLQVPTGSAWLPIGLPLTRFADDSGKIAWQRLLPALTGGLELADTLLGELSWPQDGQRSDALTNRRLALFLDGLGDLAQRRGLDPRDLTSLDRLSTVVGRIRESVWQHSRQLARQAGCVPALGDSDPSIGWQDGRRRDDWRRRWQAALRESAVRHRNILALSPYSVLPSCGCGSAAYIDLLPVIAQADAWCFSGAPDLQDWSLDDYTAFHRRAWAVIQQPKPDTVIAAGV